MSMLPQTLERIDDKLAAFETALRAVVPSTRLVGPGLVPFTDRTSEELLDGVWNVVPAVEGDYHNGRGMAAREGTLQINLVGHVMVDEILDPGDLQQAEIEMAEEVKAFVRTGAVAGMTMTLERIELSRLLEHPYGWVVAFIDLQPPGANTH
jgi:hypothetical protein